MLPVIEAGGSARLDGAEPGAASSGRLGGLSPWLLLPPVLAAALAALAGLVGWRGMDLPAQIYRVGLFHRQGLTLWDSQWYGGHFTLDYSVIFPPIAGLLGVTLTEVLSAALAALAFDRLVKGHFGRRAWAGSLAFTLGTMAQVGIGQLPFLLGESLALAACWAATGKRWRIAALLGACASLASPLAGAFLILALVAWLITTWPRLRVPLGLVALSAGVPIGVMSVLFPGAGRMPFPGLEFAAEGVLFIAAFLLVPRREQALRIGIGLYVVAFAGSFFLPTAVGGNVERLGETLALPLALCLLWPFRRVLVAAITVPLAIMQWSPAVAAFASTRSDPSEHPSYFQPMVDFVASHDAPAGRIEVVPTQLHWEVADVAPTIPLARGWERQLDTADNPIFYTDGALTAASYQAWLVANGVRYVALPDVRLDYAGVAEGRLVRSGVPGLSLVWHDAHWKVFSVDGAPGIVSGPGQLTSLNGGDLEVDAVGTGTITVRERFTDRWVITEGVACTEESPQGWLNIRVPYAEVVHAELRLVGATGQGC